MSPRDALRHPALLVGLVLALMAAGVRFAGMPVDVVTQIAVYTLYGLGVNFLIGYLGLVPFGASLYFGVASYAVAIGMSHFGGNEAVAFVGSVVFTTLLALLSGFVILRRRGVYFSLLTLACSQLAFEIAYRWTDFTGGENGLQIASRPYFEQARGFAALVIAGVVLACAVLWAIAHSSFGRRMQAVRDNERRAGCLGIDVFQVKLWAFTIAGATIGVAGAGMALLLRGAYANPLSWQQAGDAVLMVALGGVEHFLGALWGAIAFIVLENKLSAWSENWWLYFAPIIIVLAFVNPGGIHGLLRRMRGRTGRTLAREEVPPVPAAVEAYAPAQRGQEAAADDTPVLEVRGLSKRFGSIVTQNAIDLSVAPRGVHSVIGPNGAGKTTLFNLLTGLLEPDAGSIRLRGRELAGVPAHRRTRLGLSRSFQIVSVFHSLTVFENVRVAVEAAAGGAASLFRDPYRDPGGHARVWQLLGAVGLAERASRRCDDLSHGEKRLLDIAMSLAADAPLLLLDEPLAGLSESDRELVGRIIRSIARTRSVLLIEHDIDRVLALSDRITVLHMGRVIADGPPSEVAAHEAVREAYLGARRPGQPAPAREERPAAPEDARELLRCRGLSAGYGGSLAIRDIDFEVRTGEIVALLGRNGVGKSTLLKTLMGMLRHADGQLSLDGRDIGRKPSFLRRRLGIALVPEGRRLFPNLTVAENLRLAQRPGGARFAEVCALFPKIAVLARAKAENLSGGERQMVAIARALMAPNKVILLDEPFEGLAPVVVAEVKAAVLKLREFASVVIVEHNAEEALELADRAYVLVSGRVAFSGSARQLEQDHELQERLLGIHGEAATAGRDPASGAGSDRIHGEHDGHPQAAR
ncbi:MAG: ATP-binding cassette domain-containing protein [Betaproteobacteria bacterium]|nr:ATP-binding cassette domain-containing protein [Betaproteobacteria bacterium]MBU6512473.1 ATP-binding cassette domain-containing protein [Betaproteobacteria bacterium]MDE2480252.1 ATP-binding cassette domain-containing protein [Betaproteobacteria bacterium]